MYSVLVCLKQAHPEVLLSRKSVETNSFIDFDTTLQLGLERKALSVPL